MTEAIEKQIERFAPGFRERILARHTFNTEQLESYNPNYIGGDINGGIIDWRQLFTRPALKSSPYRTSTKGLYICSSSTPPGGAYMACVVTMHLSEFLRICFSHFSLHFIYSSISINLISSYVVF
jgi:phytoene dehydrogenase-like protein